MKNSKGTTLKFESDFDFETANAQFNDDISKEDAGVSSGRCSLQSGKASLRNTCALFRMKCCSGKGRVC